MEGTGGPFTINLGWSHLARGTDPSLQQYGFDVNGYSFVLRLPSAQTETKGGGNP